MHFCADELFAIMSVVPFVGVGMAWLKSKLNKLRRKT